MSRIEGHVDPETTGHFYGHLAGPTRGPETDHRVWTLRSIANSIQPAFPEAANELRAIALDLESSR